jgi:hypothetical protein
MGLSTNFNPFELFLASFMANTDEVITLLRRVEFSPDALTALRDNEEVAGFWSPPSLSYFEERLPSTGFDTAFG